MKHKTFKSPIIMMVLLLFAVVCVVNVTYSYFSSTSSAEGQIQLPKYEVCFSYETEDRNYGDVGLSGSLNLIPVDGLVEREVPFDVKISDNSSSHNDKEIKTLSLYSSSGSVYIRFWVDVYVVKTVIVGENETKVIDKTINYGKYFSVPETTLNKQYVFSSSNNCYYIKSSLEEGGVYLGDDTKKFYLTLKDFSASDPVPLEILGENIIITISFQAVQSQNKAFEAVFNDEKGYYNSWS